MNTKSGKKIFENTKKLPKNQIFGIFCKILAIFTLLKTFEFF